MITTLEKLIRDTCTQHGQNIDFRIAVQPSDDGEMHVIIHPVGVNGETMDAIIYGDVVAQTMDGECVIPEEELEGLKRVDKYSPQQ